MITHKNSIEKMNTTQHKLPLVIFLVCIMALSLWSCTAERITLHDPLARAKLSSEARNDVFWWASRFKIFWPSEREADGTVDLLLAHAVVGPVLEKHANELVCWRFHRRAARDKTGHQFSFLFYAVPDAAGEIFQEIQQNEILTQALEAGIVEKVTVDDPADPSRPRIGDMSDPRWSPVLQRNWPSFIMGVSSLWLGLISEGMAGNSLEDHDINALLDHYRKVDAEITSIWNREGQHALLHHLNALFGYEPLLIRKELSF